MSEIHASVTDQQLKIVKSPVLASGGVNEVKVVFNFCTKWEGFEKTAIFYRDTDKIYHAILNENDICILPWEVYAESGTFYIGVFGEKGDIRRTSTVVKYKVGKGGFATEDMMPNEPTPDVYSQIIEMYQETKALAQEAKELAQEAQVSDLTEEQNLTDEQKAQVRKNIGIKDVLLVYIKDGAADYTSGEIVAHMASAGTVICICGTNVLAYNGVEQKVADGAWNFFIHFKTATDDEGKWTEYVIDHKGAVTTSIMSNSGGSSVDDSQIGEDAWSSKNTVDKLCPSFTKSGSVVTCEPVEGYPLEVVSHIQAVQTESDASTGEWVESAIYVGPENVDSGETQDFFTDTLVNGTTYRLTVNATDTSGNQVSLSGGCVVRMDGDDTYTNCRTSYSGNWIEFVAKADAPAIINLFYKNEIDINSMYDYAEEVSVYTFKDGVFTLEEYKYSNVSTLSGHTSVSLHRNSETFTVGFGQVLSSGKNLLPCSYQSGTTSGLTSTVQEDGSIVFSGTPTGTLYYHLAQGLSLPAGTYTFSVGNQVQTNAIVFVVSRTNNLYENFTPTAAKNSITFTLDNACDDLNINFFVADSSSYIRGTVYPQLEVGSVATAYEKYEGGEVYGGYFDWNSGALTVTHGNIASYAGEVVPDGWISSTGSLSQGAHVVYPLDKPVTYQFEPQQILALSGTNTLYSSTGDTEVTGKTYPSASGGGSVEGAVLYTPQTITTEQQSQARANIGAASETDVAYINNELFTVGTGKNFVNPDNLTAGMLESNDTLDETLTNYSTSEYIPVKQNADYTFVIFRPDVGLYSTRKLYALYDINRNMISGSYNNITGQTEVTFNTGDARYVRVSGQSNGGVVFQLEKGSAFTSYEPYVGGVKKVKNIPNGILYGKKWVACGDSFTQGVAAGVFTDGKFAGEYKSYPFLIGLRNDMDVVNLAVGGMTLAYRADNTNYFSNTAYQNIDADADYITLKFGINDNNYKSPVGTIDDTDNTTFYGAWNVVLEHIIVNHPLAKIGIIVTNGSSLDYVNATIAIAEKWGIPYLNEATGVLVPTMHRSNKTLPSSVVEARLNAFAADRANGDTHPNAAGHEYESTFVENFLRSL